MNGEKAAYASPVFNIKRQRTLESLIEGLQDEKWSKPDRFGIKPDRFGIKRAVRITMEQGEKKKVFVETGQSLKVNMITKVCMHVTQGSLVGGYSPPTPPH